MHSSAEWIRISRILSGKEKMKKSEGMKVERKFVIGDSPVKLIHQFADIKVYIDKKSEETNILYFSKGDDVVAKLLVDADQSQGMPFISTCVFMPV